MSARHARGLRPQRIRVAAAAAVAVTCAVALTSQGTVATAAAPSGAVVLDRHASADSSLWLEAVSPSAAVVRQVSGYDGRYLSGTSGTMSVLDLDPAVVDWELVGTVAWGVDFRYDLATETASTHLVTDDLTTRAKTDTDLGTAEYVGVTSGGWVGLDGGTLTLHGASDHELATGVGRAEQLAAAGTHAVLVAVPDGASPELLLVDLTTATAEVVDPGGLPQTLAIGATTVAWLTNGPNGDVLHRRAIAGGPETTTDVTDYVTDLVVTDAGIAYRTGPDGGSVKLLPDSNPAVTAALTGVTALRSLGSALRLVVSGAVADSGLYAMALDGTATKLASAPAPTAVYNTFDLAAGQVYAADATELTTTGRRTVWRRSVSGAPSLALGPESLLVQRASFRSTIRFSAGRGLVPDPVLRPVGGAFVVLDRGTPTRTITYPGPATTSMSGPYAAIGQRVHRVDGTLLADLGDVDPASVGLFGPLVAWSTRTGAVLLRDVSRPVSATNPKRLRAATCAAADYCPAAVTVGGDTVVWAVDNVLTLHDLRTAADRTVTRPVGAGIRMLRADVGSVAWVEDVTGSPSSLVVLDPTAGGSTPQVLATSAYLPDVALDDGLVGWADRAGDVTVAPLPFDHARAPRLLGVLGTALSPDGNGRGDTWTPQVDVTKPLGSATVTVRSGTHVVRVLSGTAPDGSVRDVVWDGRDSVGDPVPDGTYTWTLTGDAADGDGPVRALDGVAPATGVVAVDRTGTTTRVGVPASTALGGTTASVPVTWTAAADRPGNAPVAYDVRVRTVTVSRTGTVTRGAPVAWLTATAARAATYGTNLPAGAGYEFSARTRDASGNIGPWSAWAGTVVAHDDRALAATGSWARAKAAGAYRGTLSVATAPGAHLDLTAWGTSVTVFGRRCAACGAVRVYVDGVLQATVDTRSATTRDRAVLFGRAFGPGRHSVRLVVVGTTGRPAVRVDAVAFGR